jgi:hypothetical protein
MQIKKLSLGFILTTICFGSVNAQNFANRQLEYLHLLTNCTVPNYSATFNCPQVSAQLSLTVEYNELAQLSHLGIALFTPEMKNLAGKPVCDFLERLFLELFLQKTDAEIRKLLEEYKIALNVSMRNNSYRSSLEYALAYTFKEASEYVITKDSLMWTCAWRNNQERLSLTFPANYDLILGLDKKEAEEIFNRQLRQFHCKNFALTPMTIDLESLKPLNSHIYVLPSARLFTKDMNANLYFIKNEMQEFELIFDKNFPEESVSNLFMHLDKKSVGIKMQVFQRVYGNQASQYELELFDFLCFWKDDYETYTGIEKCTGQEIALTVIFKSKYFNCFHMLYVQAAPEDFFEKKRAIKTTFYTYIPNHNIKNLYQDVIEKKTIIIE